MSYDILPFSNGNWQQCTSNAPLIVHARGQQSERPSESPARPSGNFTRSLAGRRRQQFVRQSCPMTPPARPAHTFRRRQSPGEGVGRVWLAGSLARQAANRRYVNLFMKARTPWRDRTEHRAPATSSEGGQMLPRFACVPHFRQKFGVWRLARTDCGLARWLRQPVAESRKPRSMC